MEWVTTAFTGEGGLIETLTALVTDNVPAILTLAGAILGIFLVWKLLRRFIGR